MIPYRFCPMCGTELVTRRIPDQDGLERRVCSACPFIQWGNSKPTAAGIIVNRRGEVLLGRRIITPFSGMWDIPGGFLEAGEHPEEGVRRELKEETGLVVTDLRFIGVFCDYYAEAGEIGEDLLNFYYECRAVEDVEAIANDDISALRWFAPETIPVSEVAFAGNRAALKEWLRQQELLKER